MKSIFALLNALVIYLVINFSLDTKSANQFITYLLEN